MGWLKSVYKWAAWVILTLCCGNASALEPLHWVGRYQFTWNDLPLGALALQIDETPDSYSLHCLVHSEGLVRLFTRHVSDTTANGVHSGGSYHPLQYESHYQTKGKPRHIKLAWNKEGVLTEETVEPPEDRHIRPEVPHALKDGAYDLLSTLMEIRTGQSGFHGFDARHLYAVKAVQSGKAQVRVQGRQRPAQVYMLSRTPLAGMTNKEMDAYGQGEPPLALFLSDDAKRIPLAVSVPLFFGNVTGVLVQECKGWQECAVP